MARKSVVVLECSRCNRKENLEGAPVAVSTAFTATMNGQTIKWEDLCSPCTNAVKGHLEAIAKKIEGLSPERTKKEKTLLHTKIGETPDGKPLLSDSPPLVEVVLTKEAVEDALTASGLKKKSG